MRLPPLIQTACIDVSSWEPDAEYATFPQGARTKTALMAPDPCPDSVLVPGKRYLFKESKKSYQDQFWAEIISYRVGCLMGFEVPPAFAAVNRETGESGALIEWFYTDGKEAFVHAGDLLIALIRPEFDRKKGEYHNMADNIHLMRVLGQQGLLKEDWKQWWMNALLFDALIGNTDRHQDNWGFIISPPNPARSYRLSPYFDNGTSLGHERFPSLIRHWTDADYARYIDKGTHHVRRTPDPNSPRPRHLELLSILLADWPETRSDAAARIDSLTAIDFREVLSDLSLIELPMPLHPERLDLVLRLLDLRLRSLKALFT